MYHEVWRSYGGGEECGGVRRGAQAVTGRGRPAQAARRSGLSLPRER